MQHGQSVPDEGLHRSQLHAGNHPCCPVLNSEKNCLASLGPVKKGNFNTTPHQFSAGASHWALAMLETRKLQSDLFREAGHSRWYPPKEYRVIREEGSQSPRHILSKLCKKRTSLSKMHCRKFTAHRLEDRNVCIIFPADFSTTPLASASTTCGSSHERTLRVIHSQQSKPAVFNEPVNSECSHRSKDRPPNNSRWKSRQQRIVTRKHGVIVS